MSYCIFKYEKFASCNFLGGDTNKFSVEITNDCVLEYKKEDFAGNTIEFNYYNISEESIEKIKNIVEKNNEVFAVNSILDNGSIDGCGNKFWFANPKRNREILAWNIDESINDGHSIREEYLEEYGDNLKQERLVLKVFFEICNVLKNDKIKLDLYKFYTKNKGKYD